MADFSTYSDEQLLQLFNDAVVGQEAFSTLFEKYQKQIFHYLLKHVKSPEIAEEILSDIFLKLWQGRELTSTITNIAAFLHKVAYYRSIDFLRTTARHKRLQSAYNDYFLLSNNVKNPENWMIAEEEKTLLLKAILQLPARQKEIYLLSREEGLTHEKIAEILHLSSSTVNNHLVAALKNISKYLAKYQNGSLNLLAVIFINL
ncbi:RNA polymerase sigma factor [Rhizosphaericola mali]|uniref:Sigma-70 family RNA polymerase sigma factor n=1 Tax=Rhizosphaericola mali TaxID=2545455 RepID=A0A5P2GBQ7_9BACT|nr:sigma-70 family RNA polymerase sigma factor [Rhizosphaericola mali]QES89001.1 sigma-70 family RNA polymerase sigma factor [Rhizosphaericola mali]